MGGKHSVKIRGRQTAIFLEDEFWEELKSIARAKNVSIGHLVQQIQDNKRRIPNLSSAVRTYVLLQVRERVAPLAKR